MHDNSSKNKSEQKEKENACSPKEDVNNIDCKQGETIEDSEEIFITDAKWDEILASVDKLKSEKEHLGAQYARLKADFENFKRRKKQEFQEAEIKATAELVKKLLPVLDNLERAVEASSEKSNGLKDGVRLVLKQFQELLKELGVEAIPSVGCTFDPNYHEAVERVEADADKQPGEIVEELQKGYAINDYVLRPSMVKVVVLD